MELNRKQIMKGLELCIKEENCDFCPYDGSRGNCFDNVKKDALALIKELTEENERLRAELAERPPKLIITKKPKNENKTMFDRDGYMKKYYAERYKRRKAEGRCTMCGEKLTEVCKSLLCEPCREKQCERSKRYWQNQKVLLFKKAKEMLEDT